MANNDVPSINVDYFEDLTGDLPDSAGDAGPDVGARIAAIRRDKGLTLETLAEMTGFDVDLLAGIENNSVNPQLGTLMRLSKALDAALSGMVSGEGNKPYQVTRKADRRTVARKSSAQAGKKVYSYLSLAPDVAGRNMEPLIVELLDVPDPQKSQHDGEEFIFVLSGTARLVVGDDAFDLEPGDSAYYQSSIPHYITGKDGKAAILAVLYE